MPLPTAYGTIPLGGALPEAYIPVDSVPLLGGALESGYGEVSYAVNMTAAASGSNGITVADDDDIDFGTGDFFLHWEGSLPDWTPASTVILAWKTAASVGYLPSLTSAGILRIQINATTYSATVATGLVDGASAKIDIVVTRSSAVADGSVVFYVNGAQLGASVAIAAGIPATVSNAEPLYISGSPTARSASNTISCIVGNFAPTAAEVLDLCTNGVPASWKWGSQTAVYAGNFSVDADGFTGASMTVDGNIDGIDGVDNVLRATCSSTGTGRRIAKTVSITAGLKYSLEISVNFPVGNVSADSFLIWSQSGAPISSTTLAQTDVTKGSWQTFYFEFVADTSASGIRIYTGASASISATTTINDIMYVGAIEIKKIGATMALLPDTIPTSSATTWSDTSGNTAGGTLPAAGATKVTIRR